MTTAYILIGGNMGNVLNSFAQFKVRLVQYSTRIVSESQVYKTAAWGVEQQPDYLNQAIKVKTALKPEMLMNVLLLIEKQLGRKRTTKNAARTIDADILFYGMQIIQQADLIIPHPRIAIRRFVLIPMADIAPRLVHPILKKTIKSLLNTCPDSLSVNVYKKTEISV